MDRIIVKVQKNRPHNLHGAKVKRLWVVVDEELLNNNELDSVQLQHNQNAILSDKFHDWIVKDGDLYFFGHSVWEDNHCLLVETR